MSLTSAQLTLLKTDILANFPGVPNNDDENFAIADAYNLLASPAFIVWKSTLETSAVFDALEWTTFIGRSDNEQRAFTLMMRNGVINPSRPNIRQGFADIFSGPSGATQRASLLALAKRSATRAEKLFSTGVGTDVAPATMSFEGNLSYSDISNARNS